MSSAELKQDTATPSSRRLHVSVFKLLQKAHAQSGVKDGQYHRYHRSCTKNLRNVRRATKMSQSVGSGRASRFKRVPVTVERCLTSKHLLIPLLEAERAWAYAMQLQGEISEQNVRKRQHMCRRLTRAARSAKVFLELSQALGDEETQLQAQVYEAFMRGTVNLQKENWAAAAAAFGPALAVCEALGRVSNLDLQALCQERGAQLRLYADFAADRLGRLDPAAKAELSLKVGALAADELLQSKLQAVMEASAKAQTTAMRFVESRGGKLEVRNERLRLLLVEALSISNQIRDYESKSASGAPGSSLNALFNRVLSIYDDAILVIKDDIRERGNVRTRSEQVDNEVRTLKGLLNHVEYLRLQTTLQRNIRNANAMRARVSTGLSGVTSMGATTDDEQNTGTLRPAALVTVYDRLLQNLNDIEQLATSDIDYDVPEQKASAEAIKSLLEARRQGFQAFRVYYLACAHGAEGNATECAGLLSRALDRSTQAEAALQTELKKLSEADNESFFTRSDLEPELASLSALKLRIAGESFKAKAKAILEQELLAEQIEEAHLQKQQQQQVAGEQSSTLLGRLNKYDAGNPGRHYDIVAFPPKLASIAPKPTLFDLAVNGITYPDFAVEAEIQPQATEPEAATGAAGASESSTTTSTEQPKSIWSRFSLW